jgi:hypothetical protein
MIKRLLVATLVAGSALAGLTAASSAGAPRVRFDLKAQGIETTGRARAVGTVQLQTNNAGRQRAVVKAYLNDVCPKDGFGAYLEVRAYYPSSATLSYSSRRAKDIRGCRARAKKVTVKTGWVDRPYEIEIHLYEYDDETGDIAFNDDALVEYTPSQLGG